MITRASSWVLDPVALTDEVFVQLRDAVLLENEPYRTWKPKAVDEVNAFDSTEALLAAFSLSLKPVGEGLVLAPARRPRRRYRGWETLLAALAPWSSEGSYMAWSSISTVMARVTRSQLLLKDVGSWNHHETSIKFLKVSERVSMRRATSLWFDDLARTI